MKQVVQSVRNGTIGILDVPFPQLRGPGVLVESVASLISPGTERSATQFARSSLLGKARSRPDLMRQVIEKARRDGIVEAARVSLSRLDSPIAPGYACSGIITAKTAGLTDFNIGDRVACAGAGYATHAELNYVPKNLAVLIPRRSSGDWVGFDEAAFTTLGAIALHGVRLAQPQLGDHAVVIGLGAVGLLAAQILRAHGCRVAGIDIDSARCHLARALGADLAMGPSEAAAAVGSWTRQLGADLVLVAAASDGSEPAVLAAELSRDKGRIVAVGATGLDLPRRLLYYKELSVVVSRSYGPGRYDPEYEDRGRDYPLPHVRWTERENMRAFLNLVADGHVNVRALISHRFPIQQAERAYQTLARQSVLGIVLEYPRRDDGEIASGWAAVSPPREASSTLGRAAVSFIGTGNFACGVLLPAFVRQSGVQLRGAVAATGVSARSTADKFRFGYCSTAASDVWNDVSCNAVVIATRHAAHAALVIDALEAGKAVWVEKPLCLYESELEDITSTMERLQTAGRRPFLMVGFNRRFAPGTEFMRAHFMNVQGPVNIVYRVNAGRAPQGSWITSADEGGGRILGEICHFVDLCAFLTGSAITQVSAVRSSADADEVMVNLRLANGSVAAIAYLLDGDPATPKERIELFGGGASGVIEDFRRATLSVNGRKSTVGWQLARRDKGHASEVRAFATAVTEGAASPVSFASAVNSTRSTFAILASLQSAAPVDVVAPSHG